MGLLIGIASITRQVNFYRSFGLTIPLHKPVYELGIGQQQLVEIAKALGRSLQSGNALLLVLDEPTAALTESEVDILRQILTQLREKGVACNLYHPQTQGDSFKSLTE